eukprot:9326407-Karenia_brevis.AAC.1
MPRRPVGTSDLVLRPPISYERRDDIGSDLYEFCMNERICNYRTPDFAFPFVNPENRRVFDVTVNKRRETR